MNLLTLVFIVLIILWGHKGFKKGFTKEINGLISLVITLVVVSAGCLLAAAIIQKNGRMIAISAALLVLVSLGWRLLRILLGSVKLISKLPLFSTADHILGIVAGAFKTVIVFWIFYAIIDQFTMGQFGGQIMVWTKESVILSNIYRTNFIAHWISQI